MCPLRLDRSRNSQHACFFIVRPPESLSMDTGPPLGPKTLTFCDIPPRIVGENDSRLTTQRIAPKRGLWKLQLCVCRFCEV
jgi:hypothetical protein